MNFHSPARPLSILVLAGAAFVPVGADNIRLKDGSSLEDVQIVGQTPTEVQYIEERGGKAKSLVKSLIRRVEYREVDWRAKEIAALRKRAEAARKKLEELRRAQAEDPEFVVREQLGRLKTLELPEAARAAKLSDRRMQLRREREEMARLRPKGAAEREDLRKRRTQIRTELQEIERELATTEVQLGRAYAASVPILEGVRTELDRAVGLMQKQKSLAREDRSAESLERDVALAEAAHGQTRAAEAYRGSLWRSLVLPGWGHLHRGDRWGGFGFLGGFSASLIYLWSTREAMESARAAYQDSGPAALGFAGSAGIAAAALYYGELGADYRAKTARFNQALLLVPAIWVAAFMDTAFFLNARLESRGPSPKKAARTDPGFTLGVQLAWEGRSIRNRARTQ